MFAIIVVTVVSVLCSFLCSLMEAAFYSIPPSRVEEMRSQGLKAGERLTKLRQNVDEPISAILTLNTVANSLGATIAGSLVGQYYNSTAAAIYGGVITLLILFLGEIIPKTLGVSYSTLFAPALSGPLTLMVRVLWPFVWLSQFVTRFVRRSMKHSEGSGAPSEREILALAEMGAQAGTLLPEEAKMLHNLLALDAITARELMTPRPVVYMLPSDLPLSHVAQHSQHWTFSRLPLVKDNNPDLVEGIVYRRDVFDRLVHDEEVELERTTLRDLAAAPRFVPDTMKGNELLRTFLQERQHLIIVANEFGGMEGVISLEDVLEFVLGEEIVDPHDRYENMQDAARRLAQRRLQRFAGGGTTGQLQAREDGAPRRGQDHLE